MHWSAKCAIAAARDIEDHTNLSEPPNSCFHGAPLRGRRIRGVCHLYLAEGCHLYMAYWGLGYRMAGGAVIPALTGLPRKSVLRRCTSSHRRKREKSHGNCCGKNRE